MWTCRKKALKAGCIQYQLQESGQVLSFDRVLELWQSSAEFRIFYNQLLADSPFAAYFWEHPPVSTVSLNQPYEFVLIDSPVLAGVSAEPAVFTDYFTGDELAVSFANLGGDAQLVVPAALGHLDYPHLAQFCRIAPLNQIHKFWTLAGQMVTQQLTLSPRWLSTSGLGVYWLHLRLDERPKYYNHQVYRMQ